MYDAASPSELQRSDGKLSVSLKAREGRTVLDTLRQSGCLKARFPSTYLDNWTNVVTLNTSGGIAGGDQLSLYFSLGPGTQATITAQAAERFYRARPDDPPSTVLTRLTIAAQASAEWLPQETILFDGCTLDRKLHVEMDSTATFLGLEMLIFGRQAMGETLRQAMLHDLITIHRDGQPLLHDAIRLQGDIAAHLARPAIANNHRAVATLVYVSASAKAKLSALRAALPSPLPLAGESRPPSSDPRVGKRRTPGEAAASAWSDMLLARILAPTAASLRSAVISALAVLRGPRPLPRVWQC